MDIKQIIVSVAIAIVFTMFVAYGVETFYPSPDYEDFCPEWDVQTEKECIAENGEWRQDVNSEGIDNGHCQETNECRDAYDEANEGHSKIFFVMAAVLGTAAIIAGIIIKKGAVSTGLLGGGTLLIFVGTVAYWEYADQLLKFILLGFVLAILIWLGYKKLDKRSKH